MCFWREKIGHPRYLGGRFAFKRKVVAKCNSFCCCFLSAFFNIMSRPHFCNYCKNHGVVTRISHGHAKNCPWRECVCALCMRTRNRNLYRRSLNKRSHEPAGPSSDMTVESSQSLASTSVANVLSAVNAIPPARTPTSCAAARAGKCLYFVVKMLYSVLSLFLHMFTVNSSKTNFSEMHKTKEGFCHNSFALIWWQLVKNRKVCLD